MRHKTSFLLIAFSALVLVSGGAATAGETDDGQTLYKANCKVCHAPSSPHGEYTPMTLIQSQWERFFKRKYEAKHEGLEMPDRDGQKVVAAITPEMLVKIKKFSIDHAADSEHPMTCGK